MARAHFVPTHELTLTRVGGARATTEVMVVDGFVYTQDRWGRPETTFWRHARSGWTWRGNVRPPRGYVWPPEVRRLRAEAKPEPAGRNRTILVPDALWERFVAAAEQQGASVADWLIAAGERALRRR